jgi:GNAT superfamily N-acetyltransferase
MKFSRLTHLDMPNIGALQPEFWGSIIPAMEWYLTLDFCYLIKVESDGEIAGCGAVLQHDDCAWLANIIVHKDHRNKGLGLAITEHLTQYALQYTQNVLLIATKLGRPVYTKLGFKEDEEYVFFHSHKITDPVLSKNIVPYQPQYKEAILTMDQAFTGEKRTQLLLPKLAESYVYMQDGTIQGYSFPTLGEGLTFSHTTEAGLALMAMRLQEEKRACLPKVNQAGIDFLLQQGFTIDHNLHGVKMYLNTQPVWQPQQQYGRVGGNMG